MPLGAVKTSQEKTAELAFTDLQVCDPTVENFGLELSDADLIPVEEIKPDYIYDPARKVWKPLYVFSESSPGSVGVPTDVHLFPIFEQARQFLERYPDFEVLGKDSVRAELLFRVAEVYESLPKEFLSDSLGHWMDPNWEANFETALTITQNELGIDVREGRSIITGSYFESEAPAKADERAAERLLESEFMREKFEILTPRQRAEFSQILDADRSTKGSRTDAKTLETKFDRALETWLRYRRGMPVDVIKGIRSLGLPIEEIPRFVDYAILEYGITPPRILSFLKKLVVEGGYEVWDPFVDGTEISYIPKDYFGERTAEVGKYANDVVVYEMESAVKIVLADDPLTKTADGFVAESELDARFEKAFELWLKHRLSKIHFTNWGDNTLDKLHARLLDSVRRTGFSVEQSVGFMDKAIRVVAHDFDHTTYTKPMTFEDVIKNLDRIGNYRDRNYQAARQALETAATVKRMMPNGVDPIFLDEFQRAFAEAQLDPAFRAEFMPDGKITERGVEVLLNSGRGNKPAMAVKANDVRAKDTKDKDIKADAIGLEDTKNMRLRGKAKEIAKKGAI